MASPASARARCPARVAAPAAPGSARGKPRAVVVRARRGVSPLSGETYDDGATRSGAGRRGYGGSEGHSARADADPYERDYDEVVTTLWLPMRDLGLGDVGTDVGMLQQAFGLPPSGVFDKSTAREIARWQQDVGLPKTGYFGVASREAFARAAADARNAERERQGAREARGAPTRGQLTGPSSYGPQDRPSLDALAPVTTARSGRETYGRAVRVPTDRAPGYKPHASGDGVGVGAVAFVAAAAAAAGAAAARRGGFVFGSSFRGEGKKTDPALEPRETLRRTNLVRSARSSPASRAR